VEPHNAELINYIQRCEELRAQNLPTLPSTIEQERRINPFLRTRLPGVAQAARSHDAATPQDDVAVFATIRQWKNEFK
jgi:hydroxyacylglutathione hydrolase